MVKGRQGERVRLYVRGTILGYKRFAWIFALNRVPLRCGHSKFFKSSDEVESDKLVKAVYDSIVEIVNKREELAVMSGEDSSFGNDFLRLLMRANHDANENEGISMDDLVGECKSFYFAGYTRLQAQAAGVPYLYPLSMHVLVCVSVFLDSSFSGLKKKKNAAVDEYMENKGSAAALYTKAMLLLSFIAGEATSLPLNPPFSLTTTNKKRVQQYMVPLE